ncbi:MAG: twitching motility protein PilT [Sulfurovum sp. AS07-7]|nr:MAG: twitching motility protein PilT [Sulfurovum sp. AS07-7]
MKPIVTLLFLLNTFLLADVNYYEEAGEYFGIDPRLLWSIAKIESNHNPHAINVNKNGTEDIGIMQINTVHLPSLAKYGILKDDLLNPRINIFVGAWVLQGCFKKHGFTKNAVTCYNGRIKNNPYGDKVLSAFCEAEEQEKMK